MTSTTEAPACIDCDPSASSSSPPRVLSPTAKPAQDDTARLLDPTAFVPPNLGGGDEAEYPRVVIEFCDRCRWLHRAVWTQTELFLTFPPGPSGLKAITLVPRVAPDTGGRFRVWLYQFRSGRGKGREAEAELVYDRKVEGGFPELKDLKQRIRNLIAPEQDLGHSDKGPVVPRAAAVTVREADVSASTRAEPDRPSEATATVDDYAPRFRC